MTPTPLTLVDSEPSARRVIHDDPVTLVEHWATTLDEIATPPNAGPRLVLRVELTVRTDGDSTAHVLALTEQGDWTLVLERARGWAVDHEADVWNIGGADLWQDSEALAVRALAILGADPRPLDRRGVRPAPAE